MKGSARSASQLVPSIRKSNEWIQYTSHVSFLSKEENANDFRMPASVTLAMSIESVKNPSFCFSSQALIKSNYHFFPPTTIWIRISAIPIVMREFCAIKFIPRLNGKKKQKQQQQHIMSGSVHIRIHSAVEMCNKYIWIANKCISILINYYSFYIKFYYIQLNIAYKYCN